MDIKLLELHISQAELALNKACNNNYSDRAKEEYQQTLLELFRQIKTNFVNTPPTSPPDIFEIKREIDFIFKSLEFLDSSTLNLIPYEIVECLRCAMVEWLQPGENYIIVTSLINDIQGFSFDPRIAFNDPLYVSINKKYGLTFDNRLVQINIPKALSRDYLTAVVLYHELGHFIDNKYSISSALARDLYRKYINNIFSALEINAINTYFPFLLQNYTHNDKVTLLSYHIAEYFCDLFGAQYINDCSNKYLDYLTENQNVFSDSHPSTINRSKVVKDFLDNTSNVIVDQIKNAVRQITGTKNLDYRFTKLTGADFFNFLPITLKDEKELHGIFILGWDVWLDNWQTFSTNMNMNSAIQRPQVYSIINNLIEKSISNYFINQKWTQIQSATQQVVP
ncbi:hypothetical protein [Chitinophaga sp. CB10]|uniref:hypothetical protein n=1 Tax=Chitinophaga sp. CB10 TaxID=1891659 RepID=UPI0025BE62AD|nr:hypothetical protein [Chitinophaga sp. CB10]